MSTKKNINQIYELNLIVRPDISIKYLKAMIDQIKVILEEEGGSIEGGEYWGLRTLAYRIQKKAKAHYVFLRIKGKSLEKLSHYLKFNQDLFRFLCIKSAPDALFPTSLMHTPIEQMESFEEVIETGDARSMHKMTADDQAITYHNLKFLKKNLTENFKILPSRLTKLSCKQQNLLSHAIKQARILALLPYEVI